MRKYKKKSKKFKVKKKWNAMLVSGKSLNFFLYGFESKSSAPLVWNGFRHSKLKGLFDYSRLLKDRLDEYRYF